MVTNTSQGLELHKWRYGLALDQYHSYLLFESRNMHDIEYQFHDSLK